MNYSYNVNAYFEKAETTLRTNDVNVAIREFMDYIEDDVTCDIVNGFTGEVLAIANNPNHENYCTDEVALMILGVLYEEQWGEDVPTCSMCGGSLDEHGVCEYCGVVDGSAVDEMTTAEGMVLGLIQALGGLPA